MTLCKISALKDEVRSFAFWQSLVCEILGTAFLVGMAQLVSTNADTDGSPKLRAGLCIGITLLCIIEMVGHISGGHVNPIITTAFLLDGQISLFRALNYYVAQLLGAVVGASFAYGVSSEANRPNIGGPSVSLALTPAQGMLVEVFISMFLVMVTLGTTDEKHRPVFMPSIIIGLTVATSIMATADMSGGCMNPAAAFGPALVTGKWANHWVYWVGPMLASVFGTVVYKFIFTFKAKRTSRKSYADEELLKKLVTALERRSESQEEYTEMLQNGLNADSARESIL